MNINGFSMNNFIILVARQNRTLILNFGSYLTFKFYKIELSKSKVR